MNYKVGDEVVCIDATGLHGVRLGGKYIVSYLSDRCVGFVGNFCPPEERVVCRSCGVNNDVGHYRHYRFIKLDKLSQTQDNEALA